MTEQLKRAFERAKQLSDAEQDILAERILEAIDEQEWDLIVNKPQVQQKLLAMADEAWKEYEANEVEAGGFAL